MKCNYSSVCADHQQLTEYNNNNDWNAKKPYDGEREKENVTSKNPQIIGMNTKLDGIAYFQCCHQY